MVKKILLALIAILALLAVVIAMRPAHFRIVRSTTVAAPMSTVFPLINDFHRWNTWSPWAKLDPTMKKSIEGPSAGVGSIYTWSGNNDVGEGRMTILESDPDQRVRIRLEFIKPFAATNLTELTLRPEGSGTLVNWEMTGENNFMSKAFDLFMNMDKTVGADFEKGLAQLRTVAEQRQ
ncbi:MAG TPA: SRPBCC family protein [Bryobacteraceae bacterium]|nr:SRPBCC family protein [Bryobacteraceae bacterium]